MVTARYKLPEEKLQAISEIVKTLLPGEWVKILSEFQTVPKLLLDCLSKSRLKAVSKEQAEEMKASVNSLVALAEREDFLHRTEIEGRLDRLMAKSKAKPFFPFF